MIAGHRKLLPAGGSPIAAMFQTTRRQGVTLTALALSTIRASPALRPCAARISCGERAGTPGKHGSPPGSRTRGACESQNVS